MLRQHFKCKFKFYYYFILNSCCAFFISSTNIIQSQPRPRHVRVYVGRVQTGYNTLAVLQAQNVQNVNVVTTGNLDEHRHG